MEGAAVSAICFDRVPSPPDAVLDADRISERSTGFGCVMRGGGAFGLSMMAFGVAGAVRLHTAGEAVNSWLVDFGRRSLAAVESSAVSG